MVNDGIQSFTFFHYADGMIEWTTHGEETGINGLDGGKPAQVGYDAADGIWFYNTPASGTEDILSIATTSNVGVGGVWAFRLDKEEFPVITCTDRSKELIITV